MRTDFHIRFVLALLLMLTIVGCSEFNRALKANQSNHPDPLNFKLQTAEKFFIRQEYEKALPLLEELITLTRGTSVSERVNFMHAKSFFGMRDYTLAAYYLGFFAKTFPTSEYAEESSFLSAYCYYRNSPMHALDQSDTKTAMEQMQLFLVRYPNTSLRDSCNTLMDQMRGKLEQKDWEGALQYYRIRNFSSASVALKAFLSKWPGSVHREEALITTLRADYRLAMNSVEEKKRERLETAMRSYVNFADAYPESDFTKEAEQMRVALSSALSIYNSN